MLFNSIPYKKILDWSKMKAFADSKINVTEKKKFVLGSVETIEEKEKNKKKEKKMLVTSIFSFSHNVLKRFLILRSLKVGTGW